jgi:hypothetical protein
MKSGVDLRFELVRGGMEIGMVAVVLVKSEVIAVTYFW